MQEEKTPNISANGYRLGRPPGSPNRVTAAGRAEAKSFALELLRTPEYKLSVERRMRAGTLPPAVELRLMDYAWGRPVEHVEISTPATAELAELDDSGLAERAEVIATVLREKARLDALRAEASAAEDAEGEAVGESVLRAVAAERRQTHPTVQ
jgi:hypothetical protein